MCQNCVELDSGTLAGIIITDIFATLLLALGVYCFAGHETGRLSKGKWTGQSVCACVHAYVVGVSVPLRSMGLAVGCVSPGSRSCNLPVTPKPGSGKTCAHLAHADF